MTRNGKISGKAKAGRLPDVLLAAIALVVWAVFYPGLLSTDSIVQYRQAVTSVYTDWHPPLMSLVLHAVLALGGSLGFLMLAQCLAGVFGLRALVRSVVALLYEDRGDREVERRAAWLPLCVLLLLLIPVTPLAFYLMTFWKDVWAMILMLWIAALGLDLVRRGPGPVRLSLLIVLGAALGLVRHNAVVVLPLLGLVIWEGTRRISRSKARLKSLALAAAPLALYLVTGPLIDRIVDVQELHPDSQIMALDLVGICAADRAACARLPWTSAHVLDWSSLDHYRPGDFGFIFWDKPPHVDPAIRLDYPRLRAEYLHAVREVPGTFLRVKLTAFETLLGTRETAYFFHQTIVENPFGLALNERFAPVREWLARKAEETATGGGVRWLSGVHLVWIVIDVLAVAGFLAASLRSESGRFRILAWVLLIPLGYYLSYLFATPVHDFRFMYPATLTVQCVVLSGLLGAAISAHGSRSSTT